MGVAESPGPRVPQGKAVKGVCLPRHIAQQGCCIPAGLQRQRVIGPGPLAQEERAENPRQLPGVAAVASRAGCSAVNHAVAASAVAGSLTVVPGRAAASSRAPEWGSSMIAAFLAVCR